MASQLPAIPKFIFLVFEPVTLLAGWGTATFDPAGFVSDQIAGQETAVSDHARLLALQLGNCYGLMFLLGLVVLYTSSELKVMRRYLMALSVTDVTHVAVCYHVLGIERFAAVHEWNSMMWGNIAMPTALFLLRVVYLLGAFGPDKPAYTEKKLS